MRRLAAGDRADVFLAVVDGGAVDDAAGGGDGGAAPAGAPLAVMRVYGPEADDDAITTEIEAMEADRTGTLPRLIDVANVGDGRACLVVERISGTPLSEFLTAGSLLPGQVVTALAPVVVALRHLADRGLVHARLAASDVLVDDTGRPRLIGLGALCRLDRRESAADRVAVSREGHAALLRLLEDSATASTDRAAFTSVLDLARSALDARPFGRVEAEIERALFAVAPARPLLAAMDRPTSGPSPTRVATALRGDPKPAALIDTDRPIAAEAPVRNRMGRLAALAQLPPTAVDDLAVALDTDPRVRSVRRAAAWARRRRPALFTGGFAGAAALVALLSAVPPSSADNGARAERPGFEAVREGADSGAAQDGTEATVAVPAGELDAAPSPDVPDDPVTAAAALLEIRQTCLATNDLDCVLAVDQPGSPIAARDRAAIERGEAAAHAEVDLDAITVAADLGDAMVLTVPWTEVEREPASLLMMRSEAGWRLREWFD
ncbi:protein kinase [Agromyces sp. ZXT2-6]|uniref:protein kinase n=1 Tax=Agromyces sp. ZXT2-6 TaxID=3461153 RepID=UPI004054DEC7